MVTFLSGGTGTPKLLSGAHGAFDPENITVIGNTGDDIELAGHLVCPDLDTVLFLGGDILDRDTWWGIDGDTATTHDELHRLADVAGLDVGPRYLPAARQTSGRKIARWRRFSGVAEFMHIGDRDRAIHLTRTGLLDEGHSLTAVTQRLATAFDLDWELLPVSDDPIATMVETDRGDLHFQSFWVGHGGEPAVNNVEFRGTDVASATAPVREALTDPVVIGPSNPVTSIGPMMALDDVQARLEATPVVAVSPFVEDRLFSGPADKLMAAIGREPHARGVAASYPFADAFVLDDEDGTDLDRPVVRTDTRIDDTQDAQRVATAVRTALDTVS